MHVVHPYIEWPVWHYSCSHVQHVVIISDEETFFSILSCNSVAFASELPEDMFVRWFVACLDVPYQPHIDRNEKTHLLSIIRMQLLYFILNSEAFDSELDRKCEIGRFMWELVE